ncbi:MAG: rRNA pseudouridine synthase [Acidobacteria bacterium]|nr:MAG: rRNA pseudouridine synthase [Acidobacteriota bacterium]
MERILVFHKPRGVIVTRIDEQGRKTMYDVLPNWVRKEKWLPVGRLDQDSRGMLLMVEDAKLIEILGAPGKLEKTYEVWVRGHVNETHLVSIREGIRSPVGILHCKAIKVFGFVGPKTRLHVVLTEGKNRHIRRMFGALNDPKYGTPLKVLDLKRIQIGPIQLDVPSGHWRFLSEQETHMLLQSAG